MSQVLEPVSLPAAATWRASGYELASLEFGQREAVRAKPEASWRRVDVFDSYNPPVGGAPAPHIAFLELKKDRTNGAPFTRFVLQYGLLGLFSESFTAPIFPARVGYTAWIAPDTVLDEWGRLHSVDPATKGKERLENLLHKRYGPSKRTGGIRTLSLDSLVMPGELSFSPSQRLTPFGLYELAPGVAHSEPLSWEEIRESYGVRAVLDEKAAWGVSIISTHEPLIIWDTEIEKFPVPPCTAEQLNSHAWLVEPRAVSGEGDKLRPSWHCSSLLQAMYLMLYLDETGNDVEIRKCQGPNCPKYFRVSADDGRSMRRMYCLPPPSRKESKCASRASTKMHRERQRGKS